MTEFIQNEVAKGEDPHLDALNELAGGNPHILLIAHDFQVEGDNETSLGLKIEVGGGVHELETIWHFLNKALQSIESEMLNRGQFPTFDGDELDDEDDEG